MVCRYPVGTKCFVICDEIHVTPGFTKLVGDHTFYLTFKHLFWINQYKSMPENAFQEIECSPDRTWNISGTIPPDICTPTPPPTTTTPEPTTTTDYETTTPEPTTTTDYETTTPEPTTTTDYETSPDPTTTTAEPETTTTPDKTRPEQCSSIDIEDVEEGSWECLFRVEADPDDPFNTTRICVTWDLSCKDGRRMDCKLVCIDEIEGSKGWFYQVKCKSHYCNITLVQCFLAAKAAQ